MLHILTKYSPEPSGKRPACSCACIMCHARCDAWSHEYLWDPVSAESPLWNYYNTWWVCKSCVLEKMSSVCVRRIIVLKKKKKKSCPYVCGLQFLKSFKIENLIAVIILTDLIIIECVASITNKSGRGRALEKVSLDSVRQCYKSIKRNRCTRYQHAAILFFIHISTPDFGIQNITCHIMCGGEVEKRNEKWVDVGSNHPSSHTFPIYNSWASNRNLICFYSDEVKGWYDGGNGSHLFACKNNINQLTNFMTRLLL